MSEPFVGEIKMFAGNYAPRGWAFCDGQLLDASQNDALFSLLGTIYGGDGRTTFGLPDLRGRIPVHAGSGPGLSPVRLGQRIGQEQVALSVGQIPSHNHPLSVSKDMASGSNPVGMTLARSTSDTFAGDLEAAAMQPLSSAGGSQPHSNLMPSLCVNFIIALFGVYPTRS